MPVNGLLCQAVSGPGTKEGLAGHKTGHTATGCEGTVSWKIGNTSRMLVVMYSVPYSHDFHSNWCGAGVFTEQDTSGFLDKMYNGNEVGFKRKEFYDDVTPLTYEGDADFYVEASMGSSHKSEIEVSIKISAFINKHLRNEDQHIGIYSTSSTLKH